MVPPALHRPVREARARVRVSCSYLRDVADPGDRRRGRRHALGAATAVARWVAADLAIGVEPPAFNRVVSRAQA